MSTWPFAGRDAELERLERAIVRFDSGGVVLAGPAGVGKTRLGLELLDRSAAAGRATERIMATRTKSELPFGAVAMLLPDLQERLTFSAPADLVRRLAGSLVDRAGGRRLVLLVDDAHLLDDGSAMLVHQLALTKSAFVIATVRSGAPTPEPIVAMWKEELAEWIDLKALPEAVVAEVVTSSLGGEVTGSVIDALIRRSGANLVFLRELLHSALEQGTLQCDGGMWRLIGPLHPSERLVGLIEARLGDVGPDGRALLELLAVGEPLSDPELETFATEHLLDQLEERGLIATALVGGRLSASLAHPLYGDVLRSELSPTRLRRLTRQLAERLEPLGPHGPDDLLRIGSWRLGCGGGRPDQLLAAAQVASARFDYALAAQLAQAAADAGAGLDADLLVAELGAHQGARADADARLSALWGQAGTDEERVRVAKVRLENALASARYGDMIQICEDALARLSDPDWRSFIAAIRTWPVLILSGPAAGAAAVEALPVRPEGAALVVASFSGSLALAHLGRTTAALQMCDDGDRARRSPGEQFRWPARLSDCYRCLALWAAGRFAEMEVIAEATYRGSVQSGSHLDQATAALTLAVTRVEQGRVADAVHAAREACTLLADMGDLQVFSNSLLVLATACALAGEPVAAGQAITRYEGLQLPPIWQYGGRLYAKGWVATATGDLRAAEAAFESEVAESLKCGDLARAASALHALVRINRPATAARRLRELSAQIEGDWILARVEHAEAVHDGSADRLEIVSTRFEELGTVLVAAEAAADAAVLRRRQGDGRRAMAAERRAAALLSRCQGASTPATLSITARALLTTAERETAMLAGAGHSNKQIADELCVSVRTVEARLHSVFTKLGISRRSELATRLSSLHE